MRCLTRLCVCDVHQVGRVQSDLGRHLQLLRFFGRGLPRSQQRDDRVQPHRWRGHQDRQDDPLQQPHRRTSSPPPPNPHRVSCVRRACRVFFPLYSCADTRPTAGLLSDPAAPHSVHGSSGAQPAVLDQLPTQYALRRLQAVLSYTASGADLISRARRTDFIETPNTALSKCDPVIQKSTAHFLSAL